MIWLRTLPMALAAVVAGYGAWVWQQATIDQLTADNASLTRSVAALEVSIEQSRVARRVDAARAAAQRQRDREAAATVEAILTTRLGECADAPLDPDLAAILNGLRPTGTD